MKSVRAKKPPRVKALPYESATSGKRAVHEMDKTLQAIGASGFGYYDDFDRAEVIVQFKWRDLPVTIRASAKGYSAMWLRRHPYSDRMRITKADYERRALQNGKIAVYSMLRDWSKAKSPRSRPACCHSRPRSSRISCCLRARPCWSGSNATMS